MIPFTKRRLAVYLREAEQAHAEFEKKLGRKDADWPEWYAEYIMKKIEEEF